MTPYELKVNDIIVHDHGGVYRVLKIIEYRREEPGTPTKPIKSYRVECVSPYCFFYSRLTHVLGFALKNARPANYIDLILENCEHVKI